MAHNEFFVCTIHMLVQTNANLNYSTVHQATQKSKNVKSCYCMLYTSFNIY